MRGFRAELLIRQSRETAYTDHAILDVRFAPNDSESFAAATSQGTIDLYSLAFESPSMIHKLRSFRVCDSSTMVLSIAWNSRPGNMSKLAASLSDGQLVILAFDPCHDTLESVLAHSLQAWAITWSAHPGRSEPEELYSGGDDSKLCKHNDWSQAADSVDDGEKADQCLQLPKASRFSPYYNQGQQICEPTSADARTHSAGVTAILPICVCHDEHEVVLTGSYDGCVRVLTLASGSRRAKLLAEAQLGGGVWKLKVLHEFGSDQENVFNLRVLASCMHAGPKVLQVKRGIDDIWSIQILAKFTEHESMNYASDARKCLPSEEEKDVAIVSCSFYDKKLCLWYFGAS